MILGHLATAELCRILRVSKAWNYVSRNRDLWRRLDVIPSKRTKRQRKFPASIFQNLVFKLSQYQATSLTIKGLGDFDLDHHKLQSLLEALPRLQNLSLYGFGNVTKSPSFCGNHALSAVMLGAHACLRTLHLEDFGLSQGPLNPPIESSQPPRFIASLEELTLIDLKHFGPGKGLLSMYIWPRLEKLVVNNFDLQVGTEAPHAVSGPLPLSMYVSAKLPTVPPCAFDTCFERLEHKRKPFPRSPHGRGCMAGTGATQMQQFPGPRNCPKIIALPRSRGRTHENAASFSTRPRIRVDQYEKIREVGAL